MSRPLGPVALSLSGGGGRAAGFHIGTLAYLDRVDLLQDVCILSTVSGGSFVGASYVLALKEAAAGEDRHAVFARWFGTFREVLVTARLLPWALDRMATGGVKVPSGRANLVTALAQVYDETFLHHASFGLFWEGAEVHVKDLIINATEFRTGAAFRFRYSTTPCVIGNDHVALEPRHARQMRLADVVAASSCIPVGLEPLIFPDDFRWPDDQPTLCAEVKADLARKCGADAVPIMDGGVYDNQGIESALIAVAGDRQVPATSTDTDRSGGGLVERFRGLITTSADPGTFIISDAPLMTGSDLAAEATPRWGTVTLQTVDVAARALIALSAFTVVYLLAHLFFSTNQLRVSTEIDDFLVYAVPIALAAGNAVALIYARRRIATLLRDLPQSQQHAWTDVRRLKVSQVLDMVRLRLASTWALTSWVYFNRIRQMGYDLVRALPEARRHLISHEIYDLMKARTAAGDIPDWRRPSEKAAQMSVRAGDLATKLWFDSPDELDLVIACGRMTMCFNILSHLDAHYPVRTAVQQQLYDQARADWTRLQDDPFAVLPAVAVSPSGEARS